MAFVELFAGRVSVWNPTDGGVTEADYLAHAVHVPVPDDVDASDDYFDLLPGERVSVLLLDRTLLAQHVGADPRKDTFNHA